MIDTLADLLLSPLALVAMPLAVGTVAVTWWLERTS